MNPPAWLPPNKTAAACLSVDDIHPGRSSDAYEAGGDLDRGVLGKLRRLLLRHPELRMTLFVCADWREIRAFPTRRLLARIPYVRDRIFLAPVLPKGTMRLDRHPEFVAFLQGMPRSDVALHGLHHYRRGTEPLVELGGLGKEEVEELLRGAMAIFRSAGLSFSPGICPPAWRASEEALAAMEAIGLRFVASARDVRTPVAPEARTAMSGMRGVSLLYPQLIAGGKLVHITSNFAANNPIERALRIIDNHGLLAIKAHAVKVGFGHVAVDGIDDLYCNYLDLLLAGLRDRYGDALWWTNMDEVGRAVLEVEQQRVGRESAHA